MIGIGNTLLQINGTFETYIDWMKNILRVTSLSFNSLLLIVFIIVFVRAFVFEVLKEIPFIRVLVKISMIIFLPGLIIHNVWHVFAAKKLNLQIEHNYIFGLGFGRGTMKLVNRITNLRQAIIFYWAPLMTIPMIIGWVFPGAFLFEWLDSLLGRTVFYWIWLYLLVSLVLFGLPDIGDFVNPFQITIVKTPEFYLFVFFYVLLAPTTLILWGSGITIIFSLLYTITGLYEVIKISKKEEERLAKKFDKIFRSTESTETTTIPLYIITD
ncbi:MAG: hypothetical protein ACTSQB_06985 [Candidatus Heimdallarchaeota archaeon]